MPTSFRNLTQRLETHLVCTTTTAQYEWFTDWMPTEGIDNIRAVMKAKNASGNFQWQLAIQYAAVRPDDPTAPATLSQQQTGNGEYQTQDVSVATNMGDYRLFRLGIAYNSSQTGMNQADVSLQASWKQIGTDLGTRRVVLSIADTGTKYEPLTDWVPATFMTKVRAAFVLNSITPSTGHLGYRLAYQTAGTTVAQPGAWQLLEAGMTRPGNGVTYSERNTQDLTLTTGDMWFRLGVAYDQDSSVDANYTGVLDAACQCW